MFRSVAIVSVLVGFLLAGCNDQSESVTDVYYSGALTLSSDGAGERLKTMPRANNGSTGSLLPVNDTGTGDLRFRVQASNPTHDIDQLYVSLDIMEQVGLSDDLAFSLCDPICDFSSVDAWVSGLSLFDLEFFNPFMFGAGPDFSGAPFSLWVEANGTIQEVANTQVDGWRYDNITGIEASVNDAQLSVNWDVFEGASSYLVEVYGPEGLDSVEGGPAPGMNVTPEFARSGFTDAPAVIELPSTVGPQDIGAIVVYAMGGQGLVSLGIVNAIAGLPPTTLPTQYINADTVSDFPNDLLSGRILDSADIGGWLFDLSILDTKSDPAVAFYEDINGTVCGGIDSPLDCSLFPEFSEWYYSAIMESTFDDINIPKSEPDDTEPEVYFDAVELTLTGVDDEYTLVADMVVMTNPLRVEFKDLLSVRTPEGTISFSGQVEAALEGLDTDPSMDIGPEDELNRIDRLEYTYLSNMEQITTEAIAFDLSGSQIEFEFNLDESSLYPFGASIDLEAIDSAENWHGDTFTTISMDNPQPVFHYNENELDVYFYGEVSGEPAYEVVAFVPASALNNEVDDFVLGSLPEAGFNWEFNQLIPGPLPDELTEAGEVAVHIEVKNNEGDTLSRFETTAIIETNP